MSEMPLLLALPLPRSAKAGRAVGAERRAPGHSEARDEPGGSSVRHWKQADQTVILLDWDDTLCPTSCCSDAGFLQKGLPWPPPRGCELSRSLKGVALAARSLIREARRRSSKVTVVTNAEEGWVQDSCAAWLPALLPELSKFEIVSARSAWQHLGSQSPADWKTCAFRDVIARGYSSYPGQSWKNVVSIGDSSYEREALAKAMRVGRPRDGKPCRAKCLKLKGRPTACELATELCYLARTLQSVVDTDGDLDLDFREELLEPMRAA